MAMLFAIIPRIVLRMKDRPDYQEQVMWWFVFCTWLPEVSCRQSVDMSIAQLIATSQPLQNGLIIYHLPYAVRSPSMWSFNLGFKMWYSTFIFVVKAAYLLGIGRARGNYKTA